MFNIFHLPHQFEEENQLGYILIDYTYTDIAFNIFIHSLLHFFIIHFFWFWCFVELFLVVR